MSIAEVDNQASEYLRSRCMLTTMSRRSKRKPRQPRVGKAVDNSEISQSLRKPLAPPARVEIPAKHKQLRRRDRRQIDSDLEE